MNFSEIMLIDEFGGKRPVDDEDLTSLVQKEAFWRNNTLTRLQVGEHYIEKIQKFIEKCTESGIRVMST